MQKKETNKHKKNKPEEKVENIYGVHFKYNDLFSRLLQVQKERKLSEEKLSIPRLSSYDKLSQKRPNASSNPKSEILIKKNISGSLDLKSTIDPRCVSVKQGLLQKPISERKLGGIKSTSPGQKKKKKKSAEIKISKLLAKKNPYNINTLAKKTLMKTMEIRQREK